MSAEDDCKLFVAGLDEASTEASLRELFESVGGAVIEVSVPRDRATGKPRGFAFVTLQSAEQASAVRQQLDGSLQNGKPFSVRSFQGSRGGPPQNTRPSSPPRSHGGPAAHGGSSRPPRGGGSPEHRGDSPTDENKLYIGNLHYGVTSEEVSEAVAKGGFQVLNVHLPVDADGRPRGFGFVTLKNQNAAKAAVEHLNGLTLSGRQISVGLARRSSPPPGGQTSRRSLPPSSAQSLRPPRAPRPQESNYPPRHDSLPPTMSEFPRDLPPRGDDSRRAAWKDKKKDKKKKSRDSQTPERSRERRRDENFRGSRRGYSDWDDD